MSENKVKSDRSLIRQSPTFIPELVMFLVGIFFIGLLAYNYIPGRNYIAGKHTFEIQGQLLNFVLLILSCSMIIGLGIAMMVTGIVGRYKDKIMWPHHISFVTSFAFMATGVTCMCLVLLI